MEDLVAEEVRRQLALLSPRLTQYIKRVEVETYALNRLPALYASSKEGWLHQKRKAGNELLDQIKQSVRQAIAAVQRDLLRSSTPLVRDEDEAPVSTVATQTPDSRSRSGFKSASDEYLYWRRVRSSHRS
ncbi:MAG: late competence development ComFB family protein [Limnospira sp.]